jgi:predicted small secreted protein
MEQVKLWQILLVSAVIMTMAVWLSSCSTARGNFCDIEHPWRLAPATIDVMTDAEVAAALAHNRKGEKLCGWHP